jgi:hypothetical protein
LSNKTEVRPVQEKGAKMDKLCHENFLQYQEAQPKAARVEHAWNF